MTTSWFPISRSALASLALALGLAAPGARAQPKDKDAAAAAEAHFKKGRAAHEAGDLEVAATEYAAAYDLYPDPELLYNLGQVNRLMGKSATAIDYYERYIAADPDGRAVDRAHRYIAILEKKLEEEKGDAGEHGSESSPPPRDETPPHRVVASSPSPPQRDEGGGLGTRRWAAVGLAVAGVAGLGVGVAYGVKARRLSNEVSDGDAIGAGWDQSELDKFDQGQSAERRQIVATVAGGALLAAGAVLWFVGSTHGDSEKPRTAAVPALGPDNVGLAISGSF